ncbi:hypothetical protein [Psychroserpens ponticola]|uniref:Uncharacterized protein n=1 Tax=Psychroserpens ponticola TaxID=2932268 RepID=A0ABY7RVA9_9FLAO|nr:hypothetical protein [Psychroserpens ponticola]WCO00763.1 hypothetical protein MUN68_011865 [Psychroserpens ponticola]
MKENADKHLDDLSRKVIGKSAVESPSFDFTQAVMTQINALEVSNATTYVPLISKRIWLCIGIVIVSVLGYLLFGASGTDIKGIEYLKLDRYVNFEVPAVITGFNVSQTMFYVAILFGIMLAIQISILKHQLDKRYK